MKKQLKCCPYAVIIRIAAKETLNKSRYLDAPPTFVCAEAIF
jgi:hypothetical protein